MQAKARTMNKTEETSIGQLQISGRAKGGVFPDGKWLKTIDERTGKD